VNERALKQLVGALVVAVALWAIASFFSGGGGSIVVSGEITNFFERVGGSSVDAIRITGRNGPVELVRVGDDWTVNGFPADSGAISRLLDVLPKLEVRDLVATNPDNHDRMGVAADSAMTVDFEIGGVSRSILVGKQGRRFATSYVRLPGADEVYLLDGDLRAQAARRLDDWRNRRMVSLDSAAVGRIAVERDGDAYTLVRGDSTWTFEEGGAASAVAVKGILTELSNLVASGFLAAGDSIAELEQGARTIAYSGTGEVLADVAIGSGSGDRWARTTTDDYVYRVSSFRVGRVAPTREDAGPGS
jgi:Domain of unknown function (DUF4340)